jgi:hypothetical protein
MERLLFVGALADYIRNIETLQRIAWDSYINPKGVKKVWPPQVGIDIGRYVSDIQY